jgi:hypothetical protein
MMAQLRREGADVAVIEIGNGMAHNLQSQGVTGAMIHQRQGSLFVGRPPVRLQQGLSSLRVYPG